MNPGKLRKRIQLQKKIVTQDLELNAVEYWVTICTISAAIIPEISREYYRMKTVNAEIEKIFHIRYRKIDSRMRILFKGKQYEIIGEPINPEESNTELFISAKAVV